MMLQNSVYGMTMVKGFNEMILISRYTRADKWWLSGSDYATKVWRNDEPIELTINWKMYLPVLPLLSNDIYDNGHISRVVRQCV